MSTNNIIPPLSHGRALGLAVAMRTASVFSVIGTVFIIGTFVYFPFFRKRKYRILPMLLLELTLRSHKSPSLLRNFRKPNVKCRYSDVYCSSTKEFIPIWPM
jgi:hypothetical protein